MADISVNEYVRTKNYGIFKVLELYETEGKYYILNNDKYETYTIGGSSRFDISKDIINHDFDIIKLIEVGDYVNGYRVTCGHYTFNNEIEMIELDTENAGSGYGYQLPSKDIKTIVTKEQFEAMKYKVGGEDDK